MTATLSVIRPGLQTTVQDAGRWGWQSRGVSVAGPMDPWSYRTANAIVGNNPGAAALEITLAGPELVFDDDRIAAVTGADFVVTVDESPVASHTAFFVRAGARVRFGTRLTGARAYLAVAGGIVSPPMLGSRATHVGSLGGIDGRALRPGDQVPLGESPEIGSPTIAASDRKTTFGTSIFSLFKDRIVREGNRLHGRIRVLPGPQRALFAPDALEALQSRPYSIAASSDRVGFRLDGPQLDRARDTEMISEATPLGSLQVPPAGEPILLMADRPTTGGYPKLATAITADIGAAGQLGPGDLISFELTQPREALASLIALERLMMSIEARAR